MNYEKKYKEALSRATFYNNEWPTKEQRKMLVDIFPELAESEEEMTRKDIISYLRNEKNISDIEIDKWIAWLEKQGEQPTDKVEPKFKVGDWIIDEETPNDVFYVIGVLEEIYKVIDIDGQDYHIPHCKADKQFHLWSIDDAKDGDVLETDGSVFIYAKVLYNKPYAYCGVDKYGVFKDNCLENNWSNSVYNIHPATDKQRDQLEKAIMKAGYAWDSEKKELEKIESKTLDPNKVIGWLVANICDYDYYVKLFKEDFGL